MAAQTASANLMKPNWSVGIKGGINAFVGTPRRHTSFGDKIMPNYQVDAGYWFTDNIGARLTYQGGVFKNCCTIKHEYHGLHLDAMYDVLGGKDGWSVSPFIGGGVVYDAKTKNMPFALSYGLAGQYAISRNLAVNIELANARTFNHFDGRGSMSSFGGDNMLTLNAGISYTFGRKPKKPAEADAPVKIVERYIDKIVVDTVYIDKVVKDYITRTEAPVFHLFFPKDSAELDGRQSLNLENIASMVRQKGLQVKLIGSADSATATPEYNQKLSDARVAAVKAKLMDLGVAEDAFITKSMGGVDILPTPEENRNVSIQIISK